MNKYYHISNTKLHNRVLKPRIPESIVIGFEDDKIKRVCFSTSIVGCIEAVTCCDNYYYSEEFYVYKPINYTGRIIKPSKYQVLDVETTRERWFMDKVTIKCIGKIQAWGLNKLDRSKIRWSWIEKY